MKRSELINELTKDMNEKDEYFFRVSYDDDFIPNIGLAPIHLTVDKDYLAPLTFYTEENKK